MQKLKPVKLFLALLTATILFTLVGSPAHSLPSVHPATVDDMLRLPEEKHLKNIKQLSFGGENAEAYFSSNGKQLIFQSTRDGHECDQIYTMDVDGGNVRLISTGDGRTTC